MDTSTYYGVNSGDLNVGTRMAGPRIEVVSIQIGQPQQLGQAAAEDPLDRPWTSAIFKEPVDGRVWLRAVGLKGDAQVDRRYHGGPDRAVLAYAASHYPAWAAELERDDLSPGTFGENLTIAGVTEATVCVGDRLAVGAGVVLEVSQPRMPCQNLARKLKVRDMVKRVEALGRGGWYLRVLNEGWLEAGQRITLLARPYPEWTIRDATRAYKTRGRDSAGAARLAQCPALSMDWKDRLSRLPVS